jgi:hypothetical protein
LVKYRFLNTTPERSASESRIREEGSGMALGFAMEKESL